MIVYFANRYMDILGMAATDLPGSYTLQHDIKKLDIDSGVSTFEMEFLYSDEDHVRAKEIVAVGNYILRYHNDQSEFYTIIESEDDTEKKTIWVYAEDAGLDLLNEIVQPYTAASAQNIKFYIEKFTRDSGFEIGLNEVSDRTRTLSWDGSSTASERVRSVATQFDAEIGYRFDIDKLEVKHKYIDIYERRGTDTEQELRLGREVDKIVEKKSITNLCTCLRVTGGTPEGSNTPINLIGYSYDDGDIYVSSPYGDLKSRKALEVWSRYLSESGTGDGHIVGTYSYDTTDQGTLCAHAVTELKKRSQPAINYEVSLFYLPENLRVGDNVRIVDDNGELYLSARVLETEERICDKLYRATFGDFIIKDSGISDKVRELAEQFAQSKTMYTWVAYADDEYGTNISLNPAGKEYVGIAANMTEETVSISDPTIFSWSKIKGDAGATGADGTTFLPAVDASGNISWTNDGGKTNPATQNIKGPAGPEAYVTVEASNIVFTAGTATLTATLYVDGVATTTGVTYKWTMDASTSSLGTARTLNITTLNAVYHCTCVWTGGSQIGSLDLKGIKIAGENASNYLVFIDNTNGVRIYDGRSTNENVNYAQVNSDGMQVVKGGTQVASFGDKVVLGTSEQADARVVIATDDTTNIQIPVYNILGTMTGTIKLDKLGVTVSGSDGSAEFTPYFVDTNLPGTLAKVALNFYKFGDAINNGSSVTIYRGGMYGDVIDSVGNVLSNGFDIGVSGTNFYTPVSASGEITSYVGAHGPYIQVRGSSASESLAGGGVVPIAIDTTTLAYNPNTGSGTVFTRDDVNHCVTVNVTAVYRVSAAMSITPTAVGNVGVYVRKIYNNTTTDVLSSYIYAGSTQVKEINCGPKLLRIEAGSKVYLCGRSTAGGTANTANVNTYLLLERVTTS